MAVCFANRWAAAGRRVTILCGDENGPARSLVGPDVIVTPLSPAIARGPFSRLRLGRAAVSVARRLEPDLIFGPGNFHIPVLWAMRALGGLRIPMLSKLSNPLTRPGRSRIGQLCFSRRLRLQSRHMALVALAPSLAREAERELDRAAVPHLPLPTLPDDWTMPPAAPRGRTILCIGRLAPQKNFAFALRSFALLEGNYRLLLLGEGPQRGALMRLADELGIGHRVDMPGFVPDILPHLREAALLFVTSTYEGCPAVMIEALAHGVPLVTTRCTAALPDIMAHLTFGEIVDFDTDHAAASLIRVANGRSPDRAAVAALLEPRRITPAADAWLALLDQAARAA